MPASRTRSSRFLTDTRPPCEPVVHSLTSFYREEFIRCQRCLDAQREHFSERAIRQVEQALRQVQSQLDRLCAEDRADRVVSRILRQFDLATGHSTWADPRQIN